MTIPTQIEPGVETPGFFLEAGERCKLLAMMPVRAYTTKFVSSWIRLGE